MQTSHIIDVQSFIDRHALSRFQVGILVLCFVVVAIDGFDTAAIGFIAPAIRAEWGLSAAHLAPLFGAGLFGLMAGAFLFGPVADRLGRKTILIFSMVFFGVASLASAFVPDMGWLTALRFLTGLGLGGAMPNAITLTSEYCPEGRRSVLVTSMFCGFTLGSALGGIVTAQLIADWGWRSVLVLGGVMPLALAPVLCLILPESVRYLVMRGGRDMGVSKILARISPEADLAEARFVGVAKPKGLPVSQLFAPELLRGTLLLWVTFFMGLLVVYLLSSWLPTLLSTTGTSMSMASLITAMFQIGGTVGAIVLGRLMDRHEPRRVLAAAYVLAGVFIAIMGVVATAPWLLALAVFAAGFCVSGGQVGSNALSASYYPTASRATGVSWANAIGRMGSVIGSMAGGIMLQAGFSLATLFVIVGIPAVIGGLSMFAMSTIPVRSSPVPLQA